MIIIVKIFFKGIFFKIKFFKKLMLEMLKNRFMQVEEYVKGKREGSEGLGEFFFLRCQFFCFFYFVNCDKGYGVVFLLVYC